jgi:XTP/dITP diphosphohydrolase
MRLVVASANLDKVAEIVPLLEGFEVLPRPQDLAEVDETESTIEANAALKARAVRAGTGLSAVADDTGLFVEALGGEPGVLSARWAGAGATYSDNVDKLLSRLAHLPDPADRRARFLTVAVAALANGAEVVAEGWVDGWIVEEARGSSGFGYDPVFAPDGGGGRTFAEMSPPEKQAISHRGRAFRALVALLRQVS